MLFDTAPGTVPLIDHRGIAWGRVQHARAFVHQRFRYTYPGRVRELRQRLVLVPTDHHGPQQLHDYRLRVSAPEVTTSYEIDIFGNRVFQCHIPHVDESIDFEVWTIVDRRAGDLPLVPADQAPRYLEATALTTANRIISDAAHKLMAAASGPLDLAERINTWTFQALRYTSDVTTVATTAAEALELGQGVCQDYAHVMLALCRAAGLPARYVSGHLFGEGGSHAWVEVLLPHQRPGTLAAWPFDPTNHCRASLSYITIAVGRDYRDVSPASGTFIAPYQGHLTVEKRAGLVSVVYSNPI
jgi:transglutaminase-like putative cysteine protease